MLAAALKKGGGAAAAPKAQEQKIDSASFPCIEPVPEGAPLADAGAAELAADVENRLRLHRQGSLAGSVPRHYAGSVSATDRRPMAVAAAATALGGAAAAAVALAAACWHGVRGTGATWLWCCRWTMSWPQAACGLPRKSSRPPWCVRRPNAAAAGQLAAMRRRRLMPPAALTGPDFARCCAGTGVAPC